MRGAAQPLPSNGDGDQGARSKAAGPKDASKGKDVAGKAFQTGHNIAGWDRKTRWQRAVNMARDKMGVSGMESVESVEKWGGGGKDGSDGAGGADRRSSSAQPLRRGSIGAIGPGGVLLGGTPGTIVELRTPTALKEHLKRGRGARETGIQLATLEAGLDGPTEEDAAALVAQYDQRRLMLNGLPASPSRPAALSPADRVLRAWANSCASGTGGPPSATGPPNTGGGPPNAGGAAMGGGSGGSASNDNGTIASSGNPGFISGAVVTGPPLTSGPGAQGLMPTSLNNGSTPVIVPGQGAAGPGAAAATCGAAGGPGAPAALLFGGYASQDNSAGPSTPTGAPAAGLGMGLAPPPRAAFISAGTASIAQRRFSECGTSMNANGGSAGAGGGGGGGSGSGGTGGTADGMAGDRFGGAFPSVRRSSALPADVSIVARPTSARRESTSNLRGSVDSITASSGAVNGPAAVGAAGSLFFTERLATGLESPLLSSRNNTNNVNNSSSNSRGLSRQGSTVFLAPLENPPLLSPALEVSDTGSSATSGGSGGAGGGGGGGGGSNGILQATPRPTSAGRRFPSQVPLAVGATALAAGSGGPATDTLAPLQAANTTTTTTNTNDDGGSSGGCDNSTDATGGTHAASSPFLTPAPLPRSLPHLELPGNISPTRLRGDRIPSHNPQLSDVMEDGHCVRTDYDHQDRDRDSGASSSSLGPPHLRRLASPAFESLPSAPAPPGAPPLLVAAAASPAGGANGSDGWGHATSPAGGDATSAPGGGRTGSSSSSSAAPIFVATPMMPAPPPFLQDSTIMVGPRRPRARTSATGDGLASPLRVTYVAPSPPPLPSAAALQNGWAAPPSPAPQPPPPAPTPAPAPLPVPIPTARHTVAYGADSNGAAAPAPDPQGVAVSTPDTTPPASPLMQQIMFSPRLPGPGTPAPVVPRGGGPGLVGSSAAASGGNSDGIPGAPTAPSVNGMSVQMSPSSPWPTLAPAYRRATASSPGTPTGPAGSLPTHFTAPQPPSSPPTHRIHTPAPPQSIATAAGGPPTSPAYRRASVTVPATYSGGISGGAGHSILGSRASTLGLTMPPAPPGAPASPAMSSPGGRSPSSCGLPAPPASSPGSMPDAASSPGAAASSPAGGVTLVHPSRLASAFVGRPGAPPGLAGKLPAGTAGAGSGAGGGADGGGPGVGLGTSPGGVASPAAPRSTPISDTVLADLRAVVSEVEVELAREAEAQAVIRQAQAQAIRNRIRMSESGKYRNLNNVSMPGDPWRKYG